MTIGLGIGLFFVVVIVVVLIVTVQRLRGQRVSQHDGQLVTSAMGEREQAIPTSDIGTALYVPENDGGSTHEFGVFDYGGIILLNKAGRLIRIIRHYAGSKLALEPIYAQITADQKIDFTGKQRKDLVKLFPHALGFFQLRGQLFWAVTIAAAILLAIVAVILVAFIVILIITFAN